jgi:trigger factor
MKVTVENLEKGKVAMEIEVDAASVDKAVQKAYLEVRSKVSIPGFRKGKVPKQIIEARYGKDFLMNEALEELVTKAYVEALQQEEIEAIDRPELEIINYKEGENLVFKAVVPTPPEVELGEYKGIEVKKEEHSFDPEQVDKQLQVYRERLSELVPSGEEAKMGDFAVLDFEGFIDGVPFEGGKAENYQLELGSGRFIPGFEAQIVGMNIGDEKEISVQFPEDYHSEEFAGKPAVFKVKLKELKKKVLPELNDELAKKVSDFATLEELKNDIENKLKAIAQDRTEKEFRSKVIEAVVENASVEIPEVMVEQKAENLIKEFAQNIQQQGMSFEQYLSFANTTPEKMKEEIKPEAKNAVKADLVLKAIAKKEGFTVSEEELSEQLTQLGSRYNQEPEKLRQFMEMQGTLREFKDAILADKTVDFIVKEAKAI